MFFFFLKCPIKRIGQPHFYLFWTSILPTQPPHPKKKTTKKWKITSSPSNFGLFGWRGEGGRVEESRVVLAKNKLILC